MSDDKVFRITRREDALIPDPREADGLAHALVDFQIDIAELRGENAECWLHIAALTKENRHLRGALQQIVNTDYPTSHAKRIAETALGDGGV